MADASHPAQARQGRHSLDSYEPINVLNPVASIWIVDGPEIRFGVGWLKFPFSTRITILRLRCGEMVLHSPVRSCPNCDRRLECWDQFDAWLRRTRFNVGGCLIGKLLSPRYAGGHRHRPLIPRFIHGQPPLRRSLGIALPGESPRSAINSWCCPELHCSPGLCPSLPICPHIDLRRLAHPSSRRPV